jgi:hypothetical protein
VDIGTNFGPPKPSRLAQNYLKSGLNLRYFNISALKIQINSVFVREHGVYAGPKDYFVVVVVIRG